MRLCRGKCRAAVSPRGAGFRGRERRTMERAFRVRVGDPGGVHREVAMSIKKILVPLTGHGPSRESLQAGLDLAGRFDAIVEALHVRHDPATAMAYAGAGAAGMGAGAGLATIIEAAEAEA